jgi:hypothetical protein
MLFYLCPSYPPAPPEGGYTVLPLSFSYPAPPEGGILFYLCPSVCLSFHLSQDIFRCIFLSSY